jgi:hypothetical protein
MLYATAATDLTIPFPRFAVFVTCSIAALQCSGGTCRLPRARTLTATNAFEGGFIRQRTGFKLCRPRNGARSCTPGICHSRHPRAQRMGLVDFCDKLRSHLITVQRHELRRSRTRYRSRKAQGRRYLIGVELQQIWLTMVVKWHLMDGILLTR